MKKQIAAIAIGLGLIGTLAACSTGSDSKPTPSASTSASADAFTASHNYCDKDGYLDIAGGTKQKFGDCKVISLVGDNREVTVGASEELYFEGSGNTIHAESVKKVDFLSTSGNKLVYSGAAPEVVNQGENVVEAAK